MFIILLTHINLSTVCVCQNPNPNPNPGNTQPWKLRTGEHRTLGTFSDSVFHLAASVSGS